MKCRNEKWFIFLRLLPLLLITLHLSIEKAAGQTQCISNNCESCPVDRAICVQCGPGFGLNAAAACESCAQNCNSCEKAGGGKCDENACVAGYTDNINGICEACGDNCRTCNAAGEGSCDVCINNYVNEANMCVACDPACDPASGCDTEGAGKCDTECAEGFTLNANNNCEIVCDPNCVIDECTIPNTCDGECVDGYGLLPNKTCVECPPNCANCSSENGECILCDSGYVLDADTSSCEVTTTPEPTTITTTVETTTPEQTTAETTGPTTDGATTISSTTSTTTTVSTTTTTSSDSTATDGTDGDGNDDIGPIIFAVLGTLALLTLGLCVYCCLPQCFEPVTAVAPHYHVQPQPAITQPMGPPVYEESYLPPGQYLPARGAARKKYKPKVKRIIEFYQNGDANGNGSSGGQTQTVQQMGQPGIPGGYNNYSSGPPSYPAYY